MLAVIDLVGTWGLSIPVNKLGWYSSRKRRWFISLWTAVQPVIKFITEKTLTFNQAAFQCILIPYYSLTRLQVMGTIRNQVILGIRHSLNILDLITKFKNSNFTQNIYHQKTMTDCVGNEINHSYSFSNGLIVENSKNLSLRLREWVGDFKN